MRGRKEGEEREREGSKREGGKGRERAVEVVCIV